MVNINGLTGPYQSNGQNNAWVYGRNTQRALQQAQNSGTRAEDINMNYTPSGSNLSDALNNALGFADEQITQWEATPYSTQRDHRLDQTELANLFCNGNQTQARNILNQLDKNDDNVIDASEYAALMVYSDMIPDRNNPRQANLDGVVNAAQLNNNLQACRQADTNPSLGFFTSHLWGELTFKPGGGTTPFQQFNQANGRNNPGPVSRNLVSVPGGGVLQGMNFESDQQPRGLGVCGPTSLSIILNYLGHSTTPQALIQYQDGTVMDPTQNSVGMSATGMAAAAQHFGVLGRPIQGSYEGIQREINAGNPLVLGIQQDTGNPNTNHFVVVNGYRTLADGQRQIRVLNPLDGVSVWTPYDAFERDHWQPHGGRMVAFSEGLTNPTPSYIEWAQSVRLQP